MIKFYYNGIKVDGGKLQKASYSIGGYTNFPEGTITIYAKEYTRFRNQPISKMFEIENNSDCQTDYFEDDRIRVLPTHYLYDEVLKAAKLQYVRFDKKIAA